MREAQKGLQMLMSGLVTAMRTRQNKESKTEELRVTVSGWTGEEGFGASSLLTSMGSKAGRGHSNTGWMYRNRASIARVSRQGEDKGGDWGGGIKYAKSTKVKYFK